VRNATQLYRTDFFPGLGWMTNRRVWESVRDIWWARSGSTAAAWPGAAD